MKCIKKEDVCYDYFEVNSDMLSFILGIHYLLFIYQYIYIFIFIYTFNKVNVFSEDEKGLN